MPARASRAPGLARPLAELRVRRLLADAGQAPAHTLRAASRDARDNQRVQRGQVHRSEESRFHRGKAARNIVFFSIEQGQVVHPYDPGGAASGGIGVIDGEHEPLDLRKPLRPEVLQPAAVFIHPRVRGREVLAEDHPQIQLSRLDHRVVTVLQQHEPRHRPRRETPRRLIVDHLLNAIYRHPLHGRLLELTRQQGNPPAAAQWA